LANGDYYLPDYYSTDTQNMKITSTLCWLTMHALIPLACFAQTGAEPVKIIGAMKNVMWKGQLHGTIHIDTISPKTHLYGLGPLAFLAGEIIIVDGVAYQSRVTSDSTMRVEASDDLQAPFFAYCQVASWKEQLLPDSVKTIPQLEQYLDALTKKAPRPFMFKLTGMVDQATIHVVNLPPGTTVRSPEEAHRGRISFALSHVPSVIIGFFSTAHQAIFTHHDTWLHLHLLTADGQKMGHLDEVRFSKGGMRLYLPQ